MENIIKLDNGKDIEVVRITNTVSGNPRYAIHFLELLSDEVLDNMELSIQDKYKIAVNNSKCIGGKKYNVKSFGGGVVISSYNLRSDLEYLFDNMSKKLL